MNFFLSSVMFSVKKVSFPAKTAVKHSPQPKLKVIYFSKNELENINEEVKVVIFVKQTNLL